MQDPQEKQKLVNRLKSVAGHVNGIARMVEDDTYCVDVIQQIQAVQAALNKINLLVLEDHMHHCVIEAIRGEDPAERERVLNEISDLFETKAKLG
jgi:DNA-binding FrmR family transcriptional regulator